jgi:hypothetical protein
MARATLRQTFIALRARRQAYWVATDFLYDQPIDVDTFACRSCGNTLTGHRSIFRRSLCCPRCGVRNQMPAYLRAPRWHPDVHRVEPNEPVEARESPQLPPEAVVLLVIFGLMLATALLVAHVWLSK